MKTIRQIVIAFVLLTVLTGGVYPLVITVVAQGVFPRQANGSLILKDGKPFGSELIGQEFTGPTHFWGRPSATGPTPYNGGVSSGSNLGPTNPALKERLVARATQLREAHPTQTGPIPVDLLTASGSGLDPHISPAAAEYQVDRIAAARSLDPQKVRELVARHTEGRQFGILGDPRVNVLQLNQALEERNTSP